MRSTREPRSIRSGFTLVEILVVLAIISILASLIGAGIYTYIGSQRRKNTENTIQALHKALTRQMKFVMDQADKDTPPPGVTAMAGDPKRAQVIWKMLKLKQAFPMTFAEAVAPYSPASSVFVSPPPAPPYPDPLNIASSLPPLPVYVKVLQQAGIVNANMQVVKPGNTATQPFLESSTMLLLALQQSRGGVVLTPDQLGTFAVDFNNDTLKEVMDGWGAPIAFFRFPTSNDVAINGATKVVNGSVTAATNYDLDSTNPAVAGTTAYTFRDPYDPEGYLVTGWNVATNPNVQQFEHLCHLVHFPNVSTYPAAAGASYNVANGNPNASPTWQVPARYMLPVIVSAGPDGKWGLNSMFTAGYNGYYTSGANPDMSIIDPVANPTTVTKGVLDCSDNIYSYRLKLDN